MIFGLLGLALMALWIGALVDVVLADRERCRNLPKVAWVLIVIFLQFLGALAWFLFGRPERAPAGAPGQPPRSQSRPVALEDRPGWTAPSTSPTSEARSRELDRRLEEWEAEQRRRHDAGDPEGQ